MNKEKGVLNCVNNSDLTLLNENPNEFWKDIKKIGENSFYHSNIKSIEIPSSIEVIEKTAFESSNCKNIKLNKGIKEIEAKAFYGCHELEHINLPPTLTYIGNLAFYECSSLSSIVIPSSIKKIENATFKSSGIENIKLNEGLEIIGESAFETADYLKEIKLPSTVKLIESKAFMESDLEKVFLNEGLKSIENSAFESCYMLNNIEIPSSVKKIENNAFKYSGIKNAKLNEGIKMIGNGAFSICENLKYIEIPSSVSIIQENAFAYSGLEHSKLNEGITKISDRMFYYYSFLNNIELPSTIKEIGDYAFGENKRLENIELNEGLQLIGNNAFENCIELKHIEIPSSVKTLGNHLFCFSGLESIKLNNGLERISNGMFYYCLDLKKIVLPDSIKSIGSEAFASSSINDIKLNEGLEIIDENAFYKCNNLKNIILPSTVKNILRKAFMKSSLVTIDLNEGLEIIGEFSFNRCNNLKKIVIPSSVENIQYCAFKECGLEEVYIKEGAKKIDGGAFFECNNLKEIHLPKNIEVTDSAFPCKDNYERIFFYDSSILNNEWISLFLKNNVTLYVNDSTSELLIQTNEMKDNINGFRVFNEIYDYINELDCPIETAIYFYDNKISFSDLKQRGYGNNKLLSCLVGKDKIEKLIDVYSCKEFNSMLSRIVANIDSLNDESKFLNNIFVFSFNLGAFENDARTRQRACNFIENLFDKNTLNERVLNKVFNSIKLDGYNKEWTELIMNKNNLKQLFEIENKDKGFISKTYNNFTAIKEFSSSNKGHQRYRKVTVNACVLYLNKVMFDGVSEDTMDIPPIVSEYSRDQIVFDKAKKIRNEYLYLKSINKINDHILNEELKEKSVFESIEKVKKDVLNDISGTMTSLNELANKKFTYEFLSKYDPKNFVLGKYCSCCSHLQGVGFGIMKASILHPFCQNLIIKDSAGKIIAKSTLYINKEQGYGVFNNIEVNDYIDYEEKKLIYKKYKKAVEDFANKYNEIYKEAPLKQINVGMDCNDLYDEIRKECEEGNILQGIDFSWYADDNDFSTGYIGNWQDSQCVLWKKK